MYSANKFIVKNHVSTKEGNSHVERSHLSHEEGFRTTRDTVCQWIYLLKGQMRIEEYIKYQLIIFLT